MVNRLPEDSTDEGSIADGDGKVNSSDTKQPYDLKSVRRAIRVAYKAHSVQLDKQGIPYIFHLFAVAGKFQTSREQIVGLLHDILEDTEYSLYDLEWQFDSEICGAVVAITRHPGEKYSDYIVRVSRNPLATNVKIEDIKHHLSRIDTLPIEDQARLRPKYRDALDYLERVKG